MTLVVSKLSTFQDDFYRQYIVHSKMTLVVSSCLYIKMIFVVNTLSAYQDDFSCQ